MSDFIVSIENMQPNIISIETSFLETIGVVEIERFSSPSVNILSRSAIIGVSDLPDIPFSKIIGNLDVSRISGLDYYLDHYNFDCGTP
jgi:hypothetical protein